jgi:hypothetical protein
MELLLGAALKTISNYLDHISPTPLDQAFKGFRRGLLSGSEVSKGCVFVFYPAEIIAEPLVSIPSGQQ